MINGAVVSRGGLLPREILDRLNARDSDLPGTAPTDYGLVASERIADAVNRSWNRLVPLWAELTKSLQAPLPANDRHATTLTRNRWLRPLLEELGFARSELISGELTVDDRSYPVSHCWSGSVPVHQLGAEVPLDRRTPGVPGAAAKSPHGLVQELLNHSPAHLWGIVTNGRMLRVLRDNVSLTRQAYLEFDLERIFSDNSYSDFTALWLCCHSTRFAGDPPSSCLLEQWNTEAARAGTRALDRLRDGVKTAIEELGKGFLAHTANADLRRRLRDGELAADDYLRALLRTVYRLLFLLVTESRDLLLDPKAGETAQDRYRRFYSMERLRTLAGKQRGSPHCDLWEQHQVVARALGDEAGAPAIGIAPLGGDLWSPGFVAALGESVIDNRHLLAAVRALCLVRDREARVTRPVDYRNLGVEELGSIYESLLELHAEIGPGPQPSFNLAAAAGSERKTTGSYYTPSSLIDRLLDSALDPVIEEAEAADNPEAALLALRVLDPACGSGHFLIAAAHRIANRLAALRTDGDEPDPDTLRHALREVIGHCVYGIDKNPMAVELCKVSLWLEAMEPGRPLNFLDHHVACGNSLLGTTPKLLAEGVPNEAFKALTGDDKERVKALRKANRLERQQRDQGMFTWDPPQASDSAELRRAVAAIDAYPDDSLFGQTAKQQRYQELRESDAAQRSKLAADAWCAAFVAPKTADSPAITDRTVRILAGAPGSVDKGAIEQINRLAEEYQFIHLYLAFPDIFTVHETPKDATNEQCGWSGGFNCVLGNPPWDKVEFAEKEFFAICAPEIADASGARRKEMIRRLADTDIALFNRYHDSLDNVDKTRHLLGSSGMFPLCGRGRINTYTVFAELMRSTMSPSGRVGIIVPTGIATDDTTKLFFQNLVDYGSIVSLYDFENGTIFPGVHRSYKFSLLSLTGRERPTSKSRLIFFAENVSDLDDTDRLLTLSAHDYALINPNTYTCPIFRTHRDAEITKSVYTKTPVLIRDVHLNSNPWKSSLKQGLFNMTSDSHLFQDRQSLETEGWNLEGNHFIRQQDRYLPLYESKNMHHYNHRWASYSGDTAEMATDHDKRNPQFVIFPRFGVPEYKVIQKIGHRKSYLLCWRYTARSTDERTMIPAIIPFAGIGNNLPILQSHSHLGSPTILSIISSFIFDFITRQKVSVQINFLTVKQLAILPPESFTNITTFIKPRVLELTYTAWDLTGFAEDLGYHGPPFRWDDDRRALMRAELDALMFHLYGINRDDVDYIMDTFPIVKRRDRERYDGTYRTKDLILDRYDALAPFIPPAAGPTSTPQLTPDSLNDYETFLDPPPADPSTAHPPSTRPPWA